MTASAQHSKRVWPTIVAFLSVATLAWFAYSPILGAWFRHDDFWWLGTAQRWADGSLPLTYAPAGVAPLYSLLYYFTYHTWGLNPVPYFALLLACHVVDSCLVLGLIWLLTRRLAAAWAGGVLFAILFCHHEAVAWPAGGPHVFAAFGILLSLIGWVLYRQGHRWALPVSLLFAVAATLTKDSGIAVLPLALALEATVFRALNKRALIWLATPLVALVAWRVAMPPVRDPLALGGADFHLGPHMLWNLLRCVPQMVLPDLRFENYLSLLQRLLPPAAVGITVGAGQIGLLALSALALWALWRGNDRVRLAVLWCYAGFLPFTPFTYTYARAPRYLYIPSIGLALLAGLAAVWLADAMKQRLRARHVVLLALALLYVVGSFGFARYMCRNRLRDSELRMNVVTQIMQHVAIPEPGATFIVRGLPQHLQDATLALPVIYNKPIRVELEGKRDTPGAYVAVFDAQAHLLSFSQVPRRGASGHRPQ
ncbi:MAG: hypothetical protein ABFD96_10050 [Armatimonadia bacterium]